MRPPSAGLRHAQAPRSAGPGLRRVNRRLRRGISGVGSFILLAALLVTTPLPGETSSAYSFNWMGTPSSPLSTVPAGWDVQIHSRNVGDTMQPMQAQHGADCSAPPATHPIVNLADGVFICKDHLMTAINADGYGVIYLTPDHMVDFSNGSASISYRVSTLRTSNRDWTDLWVTPFADNLTLPFNDIHPDLQGPPRNAVHIVLAPENSFRGEVYRNFQATALSSQWWVGYQQFLALSGAVRTTFELDISRTHIRFGMPDFNFWWIDQDVADLGWSQGVVQLGHHSYNPTKSDGCGPPTGQPACLPNTWHWSNVSMSSAVPFTIINGAERSIHASAATTVHFPSGAPSNAFLRFSGIGTIRYSLDGGKSWTVGTTQASQVATFPDWWRPYWIPIPVGLTQVMFQGDDWYGGPWWVRDPAIWSMSSASPGSGSPPSPSSSPSPSPSPPASPSPVPLAMNGVACTVTMGGVQQSGTCSGTFMPSRP
jgi:hypothetical protein